MKSSGLRPTPETSIENQSELTGRRCNRCIRLYVQRSLEPGAYTARSHAYRRFDFLDGIDLEARRYSGTLDARLGQENRRRPDRGDGTPSRGKNFHDSGNA